MKVASYTRVSTDEQAERGTIEVQEHEIRQWCERQGYEIVTTYRDDGVSGTVPLADRPGGASLLEEAEARRSRPFEAVVVYALDRLGRDALVCLLGLERLKQLGLKVLYVREEFGTGPAGDFQRTIMAAVAELERALITQRMSGGRRRAVREGKYMASTVPYGYRRDPDGSGKLSVYEPEAHWVREMFRWCIEESISLPRIAARLDEAGATPPMAGHWSEKRRARYGGWAWSSVWKMLKAPRYMGESTYGGEREKMTGPPIVDRATWEAAQAALAKRKFDSTRNLRNEYAFRGILYCGTCGGRMNARLKTLARARQEPETVKLYECGSRRTHGPKAGHEGVVWRVYEHEIRGPIIEAIEGILRDPARVAAEMDLTIESLRSGATADGVRAETLARLLPEFSVQEERVVDLYRRGLLDEVGLAHQLDAIKAERAAADAELALRRTSADEGGAIADTVATVREWILSGLPIKEGYVDEETGEWSATPSDDGLKGLLSRAVERIVVEPDGALRLEGPGDVILCTSSQRTAGAGGRGSPWRSSR